MPSVSFTVDEVPVVIGYYRYTDILFEYHKTFADPTEAYAFKAFVSNMVLSDPKHPFHDTEKGVEFYIGMAGAHQAFVLRTMYAHALTRDAAEWATTLDVFFCTG